MYQAYLNQARSTLNFMSSDELNEFLDNEDKLNEKVDDILKNLDLEKDSIITENRNIAESNLKKEPQLIELRAKVNELSEEGKQLCEEVNKKMNEIKSKSNDTNSESILALLQTATAECEEESDKLATEFLDSTITIDDFMEKFMTTRKIMHLRKLKSEKMTELLRQQRNAPSNFVPGYGGSNFYPPQQSPSQNVPYPMNPGIPMPGFRY